METRTSFETKVLLAFSAAVLLVAVLAAATWKMTHAAMEADRRVVHSHEVLDALATARADTLLVESVTRGYVISGAKAQLAERDGAIVARAASMRRIRDLTADNVGQQARWERLRAAAAERQAVSERSVLLRSTEGFDAARAYSATAPVRETREHLFGVLREMEHEEHRLLDERNAEQARAREIRLAAGALTALVLAALLAATYVLIRRQMRAVREQNGRLDQRVRERTAQLGQSEERFRAYVDQAADALFVHDFSGRFIDVNPRACASLGYSREELLRMNVFDVEIDFDLARAQEAWRQIRPDEVVILRGRQRRKDGSIFPVEVSFGCFHLAGERLYMGMVRDITERKRIEEEIAQLNTELERRVAERTADLQVARDTAENANRAKDAFLATMSHEIRTPLGGLLGMLELLSLSPLNSEQGEVLQAARDSGRSLLRILNDILDWSKIEDGKLELAPQATALAGFVAEVANTYARIASANSIILAQQVDARLSPAFSFDPLRLSQVLNNFISNAIKFSHQGGRVELRADLVARREGAEEVRFSVRDTGIGIEPEVQQRLFQSYAQGAADTARMYGGTGLGLAICRRLSDLMGGRIELDSAPGKGSTFSITLTLPVAAEPAAGPVPDPVRAGMIAFAPPLVGGAPAADAPRVLVVDDHPINRKLLVLQLGLLGLRTETATDGEAALALWIAGRHALVITDCHMPVMDGYALTRAIRAFEAAEAQPRTPVFAWTANALREEIDNCHAAGMDELLVKPVNLERLKQVLARWLPTVAAGNAEPPMSAAVPPAPTAEAIDAPVDISVLAALVGSDPATIREFLQDFRASATSIAVELAAACTAGETAQAGALAHKLKSSARSVGALALGELCAEMEAAGKTGQAGALAGLWPRFEAEMAAVDAALADLTTRNKEAGDES